MLVTLAPVSPQGVKASAGNQRFAANRTSSCQPVSSTGRIFFPQTLEATLLGELSRLLK